MSRVREAGGAAGVAPLLHHLHLEHLARVRARVRVRIRVRLELGLG